MSTALVPHPDHLKITLLDGAYDKSTDSQTVDWDHLVSMFTEAHRAHEGVEKLAHLAFSPASRPPGTRHVAANVTAVHFAVWDLDAASPSDLAEVLGWLREKGVAYITHTTWSHGKKPGGGCWRVIVPLSEPVTPGLWKTVWTGLNRATGGLNDTACKDPCRIYFLPGWSAADDKRVDDRFLAVVGGRALDPAPFLHNASPTELLQVDADPIGMLELEELASKFSNARDRVKRSYGEQLENVVRGRPYGDGGDEPNLDLWRLRLATKIMEALPKADIEQVAALFQKSHDAIDPSPSEVARRQDDMLAKLRRQQVRQLKLPEDLSEVGTERVVVEGSSDLELARWVTSRWGEVVHSRGSFWTYSRATGTWSPKGESAVWQELTCLVGAFVLRTRSLFTLNTKTADSVAKGARLDCLREGFFDRHDADNDQKNQRPGIAFRNGFLDLKDPSNVQLVDHSPEHGATFRVNGDWDPDAECPAWLELLDKVWEFDDDKAEKIACFQEFIGAALAQVAPSYQRAFIALGDGSNGKSTVLDVVTSLFPKENRTSQNPHDWVAHSTGPYALCALATSVLNTTAEMPQGRLNRGDLVKAIITGDSVTARPIREMPFSFRPVAAQFWLANRLPESDDRSRGYWRRYVVLTFNRNFEDEGQATKTSAEIVDEVLSQRSGIYAWGIRGLQRLIANKKYTIPPSSEATMSGWEEENDPVKEWMASRWKPAELEKSTQGPEGWQLHADLRNWCADQGIPEHRIPRPKALARDIAASGVQVKRSNGRAHFQLEVRGVGES